MSYLFIGNLRGEWIGVKGDTNEAESGDPATLAKDAPDGTPVLDLSDVPLELVATIMIAGPRPDVRLPPGTYRSALSEDGTPPDTSEGVVLSNRDRVALDLWLGGWRNLEVKGRGVRFGAVKDGSIVWEAQAPRATQAAAMA